MAAETATLEPTVVLYCGKCGMPPEYCEYGPDFESHCDPWLLKHHPEIHSKLASLRTTKPTKTKSADGEDGGDAGGRVRRGGGLLSRLLGNKLAVR